MIIISDASPVIALAVCDKLNLLDKLFDRVCVPQAVFNELIVPNKPKVETITEWAKARIVRVKNTATVAAFSLNLDPGESEALSLYWETAADYLLIDEKKGRIIAARNGIKTVGTIGILLSAKQKGFLAGVKPSLDVLVNSGFRMSDILYRQILERAGEGG
jgi:predicted nucleic acid-binding protein